MQLLLAQWRMRALQLLFEVLIGEDGATSLDGELLDDARGPLAELHRTLGVDLVAHRDDGGQAVVLGGVISR